MTTEDKNQQFVDVIKSELDESVDSINARDMSAITQARHQALNKKSGQKSSWIFIPVGAIATACFAVVIYSFIPVTPVSTDGESPVQENQELVFMIEGVNFYEDPEISEELDFLEWLDAYESSS